MLGYPVNVLGSSFLLRNCSHLHLNVKIKLLLNSRVIFTPPMINTAARFRSAACRRFWSQMHLPVRLLGGAMTQSSKKEPRTCRESTHGEVFESISWWEIIYLRYCQNPTCVSSVGGHFSISK